MNIKYTTDFVLKSLTVCSETTTTTKKKRFIDSTLVQWRFLECTHLHAADLTTSLDGSYTGVGRIRIEKKKKKEVSQTERERAEESSMTTQGHASFLYLQPLVSRDEVWLCKARQGVSELTMRTDTEPADSQLMFGCWLWRHSVTKSGGYEYTYIRLNELTSADVMSENVVFTFLCKKINS